MWYAEEKTKGVFGMNVKKVVGRLTKLMLICIMVVCVVCAMQTFAAETGKEFIDSWDISYYEPEDDVTATLYEISGGYELVVSGTGKMGYPALYEHITNPFSIISLVIENGVTSVGGFDHCSISEIYLPPSVVEIQSGAFFTCKDLKKITGGENLKEIGDYAFEYTGLEVINLPASLEKIGKGIFMDSSLVETITIAEENKYFKTVDDVLYTKDGKKLIVFPSGKYVQSFTVPESVERIEPYAFSGSRCSEIHFNEGLKTIGYYAFHNAAFKNIKLPSTMETIEWDAFHGSYIESIELNEGLKTIEDGAFCITSIEKVVIPASVTDVGDAFSLVPLLKEITFLGENTEIGGIYSDDWWHEESSGFIIRGHKDSTAEAYAEENGITFVELCEDGKHKHHLGVCQDCGLDLGLTMDDEIKCGKSIELMTEKGVRQKYGNVAVAKYVIGLNKKYSKIGFIWVRNGVPTTNDVCFEVDDVLSGDGQVEYGVVMYAVPHDVVISAIPYYAFR